MPTRGKLLLLFAAAMAMMCLGAVVDVYMNDPENLPWATLGCAAVLCLTEIAGTLYVIMWKCLDKEK